MKSFQRDLKTHILIEVVALFLITILIVSMYSYYNNRRALSDFAQEYVRKHAVVLTDGIEKKMAEADSLTGVLTTWLSSQTNLSQTTNLSSFFENDQNNQSHAFLNQLLTTFQGLSSFYIGFNNGDFWEFGRVGEEDSFPSNAQKKLPAIYHHSILFLTRGAEKWSFFNAENQKVGDDIVPASTFDPRNRPWYFQACQKKKKYLSDLYAYGVNHLVLTTSQPLIGAQGECLGVLGADIDVRRFSRFLKDRKISPSAEIFIMDRDFHLIASSQLNYLVKQEAGKSTLRETPAGGHAVLARAIAERRLMREDQLIFQDQGREYVLYFGNFSGGFYQSTEKRWQIAIIVPMTEIVANFLRVQDDSMGIYLFVLAMVLVEIIILARRISDPISIINEAAQEIKAFNFEGKHHVESKIREVRTLSETVESMKLSLRTFTKYMPKNLVLKLLEKNQDVTLGGELRQLTVMFSDVVDFTKASERLQPAELMLHLSAYLDHLSQIIIAQQGTIDKYIGDAIMAFWGAPDEDEQKNEHACRAVLECIHALKKLNAEWQSQGKPEFYTRFGVHCGDCIVGNVGSSERMNYTVVGDSVNLASRLESANKFYRTSNLISETVFRAVKSNFLCCPIDVVAVKGKVHGVRVYELLGQFQAEAMFAPTPDQEAFVKDFSQAFESYLQQNWSDALAVLSELKQKNGISQELVEIYIDRCKQFRRNPPPPHWDGTFHLKTK